MFNYEECYLPGVEFEVGQYNNVALFIYSSSLKCICIDVFDPFNGTVQLIFLGISSIFVLANSLTNSNIYKQIEC